MPASPTVYRTERQASLDMSTDLKVAPSQETPSELLLGVCRAISAAELARDEATALTLGEAITTWRASETQEVTPLASICTTALLKRAARALMLPLLSTWGDQLGKEEALKVADAVRLDTCKPGKPVDWTPTQNERLLVLAGELRRGDATAGRGQSIVSGAGTVDPIKPTVFACLPELDKVLGGVEITGNMYTRSFDGEETQIDLFDIVSTKLPLVSLTSPIVTELLVSEMKEGNELAIVDIGIGHGRQQLHLLEILAQQGKLPGRVTIIGVDPDADSLQRAEALLLEFAAKQQIQLTFHGIAKIAEDVSEEEWESARGTHSHLIVHCAFALHHIPTHESRRAALTTIKKLNPALVVLVEPNVDHYELQLTSRFTNTWRFFSQVFQVIDKTDVLVGVEKEATRSFFGREIHDIIANANDQRSERHEPVETWLGHCAAAGLQTVSPRLHHIPSAIGCRSAMSVQVNDGHIGVLADGKELVSIICTRC